MIPLAQLTAWTSGGESEPVEFKKSTAEKERACRVLCAFANGHGGCVLIGVTPAGKPVGQIVTERTLEPWNPMIARTFYRRGVIETWGRGTLKIARLMREAGHEPPRVAVRSGAVVVTFAFPDRPSEETTGKTTGKTPAAVLQVLADDPYLSVPELAARLDRSELTIHRAIRKLRESNRLERIGPDKGGHWQVIE